MTMSVLTIARDQGKSNYHTKSFRRVIEDHLDVLRETAIVDTVVPTARQYGKFVGDFTGLLIELKVKEKLHWITMRINGLHCSSDYLDETMVIRLVSPSVIERLLDRHLSTLSRL